MSLPEAFNSPVEYFEESMSFFHGQQHLYNFANIRILSSDCFDKTDVTGLEDVDLFDKQLTLQKIIEKNASFKALLENIQRLSVDTGRVERSDQEDDINVPLGTKKRHEIVHLAKVITEVCETIGCSTVVDFGSGLVRLILLYS